MRSDWNCDRIKARTTAERFGVRQSFVDIDDAMDAVEPNLVDLIAPPSTRRDLVAKCIERSIPVICQKPVGTSYIDAPAMTGLAERADVRLIIHENFRWQLWYREARHLLATGALGTPHSVAFHLRSGDGQGGEAQGAGQIYFKIARRPTARRRAISDR